MSDVIVSTTESTTDVTTTNDVTTVAITNTVVEISQATAGLQGVPGSNSDPIYIFVRNSTGAQLNKGTIVYVSGANGTHVQVTPASASSDATSARTVGWLAEDIANNASGLCQIEGYLEGVNTQAFDEGDQLYLSTTAGGFTATKPQAPTHLVYVGVVAKKSAGNGKVFVKVQNGYELDELHDVRIVSKADKNLIQYDSATSLWVNVAATAVAVGSAITAGTSVYATNAGTSVYASTAGTSVYATNAGTAVDLSGSITKSQVSDFTSGTVASASTAQQAGTAVYATTSGSASVAGSAVAYTGSITISQITDLANATVTSAATAQQAGTAVYALTSGTADYATTSGTSVYATTSGTAVTITGSITRSQVSDFASGTVATITGSITRSQVSNFSSGTVAYATSAGFASEADTANNATNAVSANTALTAGTASYATTSGTAVSISGSITRSQVSDFASGTVANISGTVAQSQVTNLTTDLAGKANLAGGNSFTGAQIITASTATDKPLTLVAAAGQTADLFSTAGGARIPAAGNYFIAPGIQATYVMSVTAGATSVVPLTVTGVANQSANLVEVKNSGSTVIARVDKNGAVSANYFGPSATGLLGYLDWTTSSPLFQTGGTAVVGIRVRGAASQSANLLELQDSSASTVVAVNPFGAASFGTNSILGRVTVSTGTTGTIGAVIRGVASQTADLISAQNSGGTTLFSVASSGAVFTNSTLFSTLQSFIYGAGDYSAALNVQTRGTANPGVVIRGRASQSANLQEWQDSTGSTAARVDANGNVYGGQLRTTNSNFITLERNSGSEITMVRQTASPGVPGANTARLYFVAGTNANTLKLCVKAGAAGAETTILDNIPT